MALAASALTQINALMVQRADLKARATAASQAQSYAALSNTLVGSGLETQALNSGRQNVVDMLNTQVAIVEAQLVALGINLGA